MVGWALTPCVSWGWRGLKPPPRDNFWKQPLGNFHLISVLLPYCCESTAALGIAHCSIRQCTHTAPFEISNGIKQGCVLAPVLFSLFFTCVLNHALKDLNRGIYIKYRLNGFLFDLRWLRPKIKTVERLVTEALFADDCALMADTEVDLQLIVSKFAEVSQLFGLTISLGKTEVLYQPSPASTVYDPPTILIWDTALKTVEHFKCLGSVISSDCSLDREISTRISKASQALGCRCTHVMNHKSIKLPMKVKVYKAVVLTSLLYGCETWTLYRKHIKQLERFHMRSLQSIMGIKWQDRVTNLEILDRASLASS